MMRQYVEYFPVAEETISDPELITALTAAMQDDIEAEGYRVVSCIGVGDVTFALGRRAAWIPHGCRMIRLSADTEPKT